MVQSTSWSSIPRTLTQDACKEGLMHLTIDRQLGGHGVSDDGQFEFK